MSLSAQRCLPGMKGVKVSGGLVDGFHADRMGFYTGIGFDRYMKNGNRWLVNLEYGQKNSSYDCYKIPVTAFTLDSGYNFQVFTDSSGTLFCSLGFAAIAGYEIINWGESLLKNGAKISNTERLIYGGVLNAEVETYLSDKVVVCFRIKERMLFNSAKPWLLQCGIGLKYIIR